MEIPRDPLGESDGDDNQSGFRRLMANTTFESPFAKKKPGFSPLGLDEVSECGNTFNYGFCALCFCRFHMYLCCERSNIINGLLIFARVLVNRAISVCICGWWIMTCMSNVLWVCATIVRSFSDVMH